MKVIKVLFETDEEVCSFVRAANNCEGEVDVRYGSCVVDGKSVLGVLGLGLHKPLEIILHSEEDQSRMEQLSFRIKSDQGLKISARMGQDQIR